MKLEVRNQALVLLPQGGVFLPDGDPTLVVADLHLGKAAVFRAHGLAVPEGDSEQDLKRLEELAEWQETKRVIVNGDLFHAPAGITPELERLLETFYNRSAIDLELVMGNHDQKLPRLPFGLKGLPHLDRGVLRIVHDPQDSSPDHFNLCAHWHPVVKIADGKRTALRLPCFLLRGNLLVMPSFGLFTGGAVIRPEPGDRFFVFPGERVIEVPAELLR